MLLRRLAAYLVLEQARKTYADMHTSAYVHMPVLMQEDILVGPPSKMLLKQATHIQKGAVLQNRCWCKAGWVIEHHLAKMRYRKLHT